jgi:hypothetical protein
LFFIIYKEFSKRCYFQEAFGFHCVDAGPIDGYLGSDIEAAMFRRVRKSNLWPIGEAYKRYSDDDLFDVIEFLYDCVSEPVEGDYHSYSDCGWHYRDFDRDAGRAEFRHEINTILQDYRDGYELSEAGEILEGGQPWLAPLLDAQLPSYNPINVENRVEAAVIKFRRRGTSASDRRDAIRDLAEVLEFLRPKLKITFASKDENDLFNIANNFAIRHHNEQQRRDYDQAIWYCWIFYIYLATIHAALRLIIRHETAVSTV